MHLARTTTLAAGLIPLATPVGAPATAACGHYELGYGERTFEQVAGNRHEQAVGVRATLGSSFVPPVAGRKLEPAVTMSIEAVGRDLEGFWDPAEKTAALADRNGYVLRLAAGFNW